MQPAVPVDILQEVTKKRKKSERTMLSVSEHVRILIFSEEEINDPNFVAPKSFFMWWNRTLNLGYPALLLCILCLFVLSNETKGMGDLPLVVILLRLMLLVHQEVRVVVPMQQ